MDRNFAPEAAEMAQGFVLACTARATTGEIPVSFDDR